MLELGHNRPAPGNRLGPVDRVHFLDEPRRNRRACWRFSVFAIVAVALSGLPLCILLSPLLFGLLLAVVHIVNVVAPGPSQAWHALDDVARAVPNGWAIIRRGDGSVPWPLVAAALVVPGAAVMLVTWVWIRVLLRRVGAGSM
jgi:hypothetical protein